MITAINGSNTIEYMTSNSHLYIIIFIKGGKLK